MAYAFAYPDSEERGRGNKAKSSEPGGFSSSRLRDARAILNWSREKAFQKAISRGAGCGKEGKVEFGRYPYSQNRSRPS
jgi:hypothetical protein